MYFEGIYIKFHNGIVRVKKRYICPWLSSFIRHSSSPWWTLIWSYDLNEKKGRILSIYLFIQSNPLVLQKEAGCVYHRPFLQEMTYVSLDADVHTDNSWSCVFDRRNISWLLLESLLSFGGTIIVSSRYQVIFSLLHDQGHFRRGWSNCWYLFKNSRSNRWQLFRIGWCGSVGGRVNIISTPWLFFMIGILPRVSASILDCPSIYEIVGSNSSIFCFPLNTLSLVMVLDHIFLWSLNMIIFAPNKKFQYLWTSTIVNILCSIVECLLWVGITS